MRRNFGLVSHLVVERPRPRRRQESTAGAREGDARAQQCRPHQNDETLATRPKLKTTENNERNHGDSVETSGLSPRGRGVLWRL